VLRIDTELREWDLLRNHSGVRHCAQPGVLRIDTELREWDLRNSNYLQSEG
jgi:hypothetical protein